MENLCGEENCCDTSGAHLVMGCTPSYIYRYKYIYIWNITTYINKYTRAEIWNQHPVRLKQGSC